VDDRQARGADREGGGGVTHLRRAEWRVETCTQVEAREFIERVHYAGGAPNTSVARHALLPVDEDKIMGIALWLPPTRAAALSVNPGNPRGVLSLSRLCIAEGMPTNSASFLLGRSMKMIDRQVWPTLLTYADTREGHTGAIYKATNWICLGERKGDPGWRHRITGERRGRKRGARNLTPAELEILGFERLAPMPKIKYIHHAKEAAA
jgi:hypothetical protein